MRTRDRWQAGAVLLALFCLSLTETMVAPALPALQAATGATPAQLGWVFTGLLLTGAVAVPVIGRLADLCPKPTVLLVVLIAVCVGSAISARANGIAMLAAGQVLQGLGLGMVPLAVGLLAESLPPARRALGNGLVVGAMTSSTAIGLLCAGPLVRAAGWQAIYVLPLVPMLGCLVVLLLTGAASRDRQRVRDTSPLLRLDWAGALLLALALVGLLTALTLLPDPGWAASPVLGLGAMGMIALGAWWRHERRHPAPLLDLRLLADRQVSHAAFTVLSVGFASLAAYLMVPLWVVSDPRHGAGLGAPAEVVGWVLLPLGLGATVTAPFAAWARRHCSDRAVLFGGAVTVLTGCAGLLWSHSLGAVAAAMGLLGLGVGVVLSQAMNIVVEHAGLARASSAAALLFVVRNVGATTGVQVSATLLGSAGAAGSDAFSQAFALAAVVAAAGALAAFSAPRVAPLRAAAGEVAP